MFNRITWGWTIIPQINILDLLSVTTSVQEYKYRAYLISYWDII